jgi:hypothetical protein
MRTLKFVALSVLTLAVGLAADHPITVSGGSPLILDHDSWDRKDDYTLGTTVPGNTVTYIDGTTDGRPFGPIDVKGQPLNLSLTFGAIKLTVTIDQHGQPVVAVDSNTSLSNDFTRNGNQFVSNDTKSSIQGLAIIVAGVDKTPSPIANHTVIRIHYE